MLEKGHIKLHRVITGWEWYSDPNTRALFIHLILTVNYEDEQWKGIVVKRGQRVTSLEKLASELSLSVQNIRTAIKHLISTGEVTDCSTSKNRIITVNNYDNYQSLTNNLTINQQTTNNKERKQIKQEVLSLECFRTRYTVEQLKIIDNFFDILKHTRKSCLISQNVILGIYQDWEKHEAQKVVFALEKYIRNPGLHDKKENYVLGIINNTTMAEVANPNNKTNTSTSNIFYPSDYGGREKGG